MMNGEEHLFEGIVKGEIIEEKRGGAGFGYDPIFVPEGYDLTFAELGNDIKNTISHRARAVEKLCQFLKK
jgi:XTP/dITP diphosphohydrolase